MKNYDFDWQINEFMIYCRSTQLEKLLSEAVGTVFLVQARTIDITLEVGFKVVDIDVSTMIFDREKLVALYIPVLEPNPSSQSQEHF